MVTARGWEYRLPIMVRSTLAWACAFLTLQIAAFAGTEEELFLQEKPIKEEAAVRQCEHLFRVISIPTRPYAVHSYVIKFYLSRQAADRPASGYVMVKFRLGATGFVSRSRDLQAAEIAEVWMAVQREEIFSLPVKQLGGQELKDFTSRVKDGPGRVVFSHYDKMTGRTEEVVRWRLDSEPAARVAASWGKIVEDLAADLEKQIDDRP